MNKLYDKNTSRAIQSATASFKQLNEEIKKLSRTVKSVVSDMTGKFGEVSNATKELDVSVSKTITNMENGFAEVTFVNILNNIRNLAEGFTSLIAPSLGFQQNMANISASTGIAGKDLDELGRIARQTGTQTGEGATAAAAAFHTLASRINVNKAGLEGLKNLQQETAILSKASGLSADEAVRVVNILAAGSMNGAASFSEMICATAA